MLGLSTVLLLSCATPQGDRVQDTMLAYSVELPPAWRQMTPVEARDLRSKMPRDVGTLLVLSRIDRFGAVDDWIARGFDGRCLTVTREDGEPALTNDTLQQVREVAKERSATTEFGYEIQNLELSTVGGRHHPAIESTILVRTKDGEAIAKLLEFIVPTGGKTLRFSFRASPQDFPAAETVFRATAGSLQIARPPEGRKELSDKLRMPLIIGGVVGLIFLVLYKMRKV